MTFLSKEQLRILKELDVDAAMQRVAKRGFIPDNRKIALAGLHKARLRMYNAFTEDELEESRRWLRANNYRLPYPRR